MMRVEVEIMLIQLRKNIALLWILRILAVPVVLVLFAAGFLLNLLYGVVGAFGGLLSLLGGVAAMLALLDLDNGRRWRGSLDNYGEHCPR